MRADTISSTSVHIRYYRWAGRFLWFRIRTDCEECDLTRAVLDRLFDGPLRDKPVRLTVKPWLNNWWRILWRGAWHAPVVMLNGRVFSQGICPDVQALIRAVAHELCDDELAARAATYTSKTKAQHIDDKSGDTVVFFSPACPHCRQLRNYLDANGVVYTAHDVTASTDAYEELLRRTKTRALPVTCCGDTTVVGFNREQLRALLNLSPSDEKPPKPITSTRPHPQVKHDMLRRTIDAAKTVLNENRTSTGTRASRHLYPHQWNWDAGFVARGYLHVDPELAYSEMRLLFRAQWHDGFLPHIVFNEEFLNHFPGADYWKAERSGRLPPQVHTSGIGQPPVHASMLVAALDLDPDRDRAISFLREMYPKLRDLHRFYIEQRDPDGEGLVFLVHPWESGIDNAPLWDEPLAPIEGTSPWSGRMRQRYDELAEQGNRPKRSYIEKYSFLVEQLFETDYNWQRIAETHPFQIQDVLFNTVLCRAEQDLSTIAEAIGEDPNEHHRNAERIADAMNRILWDDDTGMYLSRDRIRKRLIHRDTIFSYMPLYAGICDTARSKRLMDNLRTHCFCVADHECIGIPTYDMCQIDYQGEFYWRGPVWFNMCWYMVHAFRDMGKEELADWLTDSLLRLVADNGFYEYYEPESGRGLGADSFSWTAALFIDLAMQCDKEA